jgi:hypothetical protein
MGPPKAKMTKGAVLGMVIKPSSLREELVMSLRTIVSTAASVIIGIACISTVSTDTFARDAGMTRLNHNRVHHHTINHGRAAHPGSMGKAAPAAR